MALDLSAPFVWGSGGRRMTPEEILAERKASQALGNEAMSTAPVGHWSQGLNRVLQGLMAGYDSYSADQASKQNAAESSELIAALLGGGGVTPTAPVAAASAPAPVITPSVSTPMGGTSIPAGRDEFVNTVMPLAQEASARTGIDPRLIVAQAAVESGWGKSAPGNNLFGIKSHGAPGGNVLPTTEVVNGQPVRTTDSFMSFASPADSVSGYADFILKNPRYGALRSAQGLDAQLAALGESGYATDPNYAAKVGAIARSLPGPAPAQTVENGDQPSPLDVAQYPAGPVGGPSDNAALPANAQPTQGQMPVAARPASGINPAIVKAMTSPYVSEQTRNIAGLLFKSQLDAQQKAADPLRALQLRKAQAEVTPIGEPYKDADGNLVQKDIFGKVTVLSAADKAPSSVSEYKYYADQEKAEGRTPLPYGQWDTARRRSGATNISTGTIPQGYEQFTDPSTGAIRMRPIPGGPKDTSEKDKAKADARETSTDVVTNAAKLAREAIAGSTLPATGTVGNLLSSIGETGAAELQRQVGVLKSNATIENLNAMRAQSPTGGALGNVTEGEGQMLAAKSGALDPRAKKEQFQKALDDYERTLLRIVHGKEAGDKIYDQTRPSDKGWQDIGGGVKIRRK